MSPRGTGLILAACLILLAGQFRHEVARADNPPGANPSDPTHNDRHGDPLPPGALDRLGTYRLRQGNSLHSVAFSPDGKTIASAGDGPIRVWDLATGKERQQIKGQKDTLRSLIFSRDGKTLVAAGLFTDALYFWDASTGQYLRHIGRLPFRDFRAATPEYEVGCLTLLPDSKTLAHVRGEVRFHDVATGQERSRLKPEKPELCFQFICTAFSPDGKRLATGDFSNNVCLWETGGKHLLMLTGHKAAVLCLAFSPDGKLLASASADGQLRLWDAATGKFLRLLPQHHSPVRSVLFAADGKHLIAGSHDRISLCDIALGAEVRQFSGHNGTIRALALSPNGRLLAGAGPDGTVRLWEITSGKPFLPFDGHRAQIRTLGFRRDGAVLASGGYDGILLWDIKAGKVLRPIGGEKVCAEGLAWSPDMRCLACAAGNKGLLLLEASTGKELRRLPGPKTYTVEQVVSAPDGSFLASRYRNGLTHLWNPATGKLIRAFGDKLAQHQYPTFCVGSPDGRLIASGGLNATTQLWGTADGKLFRTLGREGSWGFSAAFSPDGKILATGERDVHLWEVETGKELGRLKGHNRRVHTLAFSPDGKQLASAGSDEEILIWEMATWQQRQRFVGHRGGDFRIRALAFSPDGQILASAGEDTTILLWDVLGRTTGKKPPEDERAVSLKADWEDLARLDAPQAFEAIRRLVRTPDQSVPFFRGRLHPVPRPDPKRLAQLVHDLDSDTFTVREKATQELGKLRESAAATLKETLRGRPSPEVRRRAEELLANLAPLSSEQLQALRAMEALEHMGGSEARRLLAELAEGAPEARLTRAAKAALRRLLQRPTPASSLPAIKAPDGAADPQPAGSSDQSQQGAGRWPRSAASAGPTRPLPRSRELLHQRSQGPLSPGPGPGLRPWHTSPGRPAAASCGTDARTGRRPGQSPA